MVASDIPKQVSNWYAALLPRERTLVLLSSLVLLFIGSYLAVESIVLAVQGQVESVKQTRVQVDDTAPKIQEYQELRARLEQLEKVALGKPSPREGFRPYLEKVASENGIENPTMDVTQLDPVLGRKLSRINLRYRGAGLESTAKLMKQLSTDPHALFVDSFSMRTAGNYYLRVELKLLAVESKS